MDFETYMNELNEEKKYKSKPTLGNIIKRDDNEKAIEIPYKDAMSLASHMNQAL